ncbi:carboxypeptidase M32 [Haliangium sp.]|uniref:carboxypeptidase M32 n=1 Tax=Haliangium sp. TaxID=2663208 RepID=UPI003D0BE49A
MSNAYQRLEQHYRQLAHLDHIDAVVLWDEATMMPVGGGAARAAAMATLAELRHERACDPALGELFERAQDEDLDDWQRANLAHMKHDWVRARALPGDLVGARSRARSLCEQAWRHKRADNDWHGLRPQLEEVVSLEREAAAALAQALGCEPYDALLDGYNPGLRQADIDPVFAELERFLPDFIERAEAASERRGAVTPRGPFPVAAQRALAETFMKAMGFDFEHGRLDVSHHPFCGGVPADVRITTRYREDDFTSALMGVIHETGHGRYEQGLPEPWREQPVGRPQGMAVHESQSLMFEMQLARSRAFMTFAAPHLRRAFADQVEAQPQAFDEDNLHAHYTRVRRGFIRVDADEATYPTHVILRYQVEKELMGGRMTVADLPGRWDQDMQRLLALDTSDNYRDGVMQDVHWPAGLFGYFPSYTLGAIIAAQLFAAMKRALPDIDDQLTRGDFTAIGAWLSDQVWSQASRHDLNDLLVQATGEPLTVGPYRAHLEARYLA